MTFKRILCAVDFSEESVAAFKKAVELARQSSARLFVLHAVEAQPVISQLIEWDRLGEITLELQETAKKSMDKLLRSARTRLKGVSVKTEITGGSAFMEILENAVVWNADLIVLGAKGASALEQIIVGSTAERVTKYSECAVLIVK